MRTVPEAARAARILLFSLSAVFLSPLIAAPYCMGSNHPLLAAFLYHFYSPICHQLPERSFALQGLPWAACHRCSGILVGLFAGSLMPYRWWSSRCFTQGRRKLIFLATVPMLADVFIGYSGLWSNTAGTRFLTGLLFGAMLMALLLPAAAEHFSALRSWSRPWSHTTEVQGGVR